MGAGFAGDDDVEGVVLEGLAEDGAHLCFVVVFLNFAHNGSPTGQGHVANGDGGAYVIAEVDACVGGVLPARGECTAVVEHQEDGVGVGGVGVDEGIDAAVIKGRVATNSYGAFGNVGSLEATGHANGRSH